MPFRLCRYLHRFEKYLRSNLKVVVNRTNICTFFALPNFKETLPQKLYVRYHSDLKPTHLRDLALTKKMKKINIMRKT